MREIAIIKDLFRNSPQVILVKEDNSIKMKPVTSYGEEIIKKIRHSGSSVDDGLPEGFVFTGFKKSSSHMESLIKKIDDSWLDASSSTSNIAKIVSTKQARVFSNRHIFEKTLKTPAGQIPTIDSFSNSAQKLNAVDYRAVCFKASSRISSAINPIKRGTIGFDFTKNRFTPRRGDSISEFSAEKAESSVGTGSMRRFFAKNIQHKSSTSTRRAQRRAKSIEPEVDFDEKSLKATKRRINNSIFARLNRNG